VYAYEIENLTKRYKGQSIPANREITLQIAKGEIFVLLGPNGAGKTTLIKQMVNLLVPTMGTIKLFGKPLDYTPMYVAQKVGYMPQSGQALNDLTVNEALYFAAHLRGLSRSDALRERQRLGHVFGLERVGSSVISRLSGGQKRLILLAMAMAASPEVLILDEPTNDLDPQHRHLVWRLIEEVNRSLHTTVIFVSHNLVEAERIAHRVAIMRDGELVMIGRPSALKRRMQQQLRLEVAFSPGLPPKLPINSPFRESAKGRWVLLIDKSEASKYVNSLTTDPYVESFTLGTPTLEDLYLDVMAEHI